MRLALRQDRVRVGQQQALDGGQARVPLGPLVLAGQHRFAQQGDEGVSFGGVTGAVRVQRLPGPVVHARRQPHEHLGRVVQRPGDLAAQQRRHQREALALHQAAHVGGAKRARFGRELAQLAVRHACERLRCHCLLPQPGQMGQVLAHALRAGPRRVRLDLVPSGPGGARRHHEQGGQASARFGRQGGRDPAVVAAVDQCAGAAREPEQRAEGGQLAAAAQQFLDGGVDDVGQVVAGARRLDARPRRHAARLAVVAGDAGITAHKRCEADAIGRVVVAGKAGNGVGQAGRGGNVGEDRHRHIGKPDDAPEMLERLEQDQERQARAGLARPLPRESDLGRPRRERLQLDRPWLGGQPRVGGVGDDRHGARSRLRRRKRWDGRGRLDAGLFQHLAHARS